MMNALPAHQFLPKITETLLRERLGKDICNLFYSIDGIDNDGDGDNDLFFGSSERSTNPVYFLENGKSDLNYYKDTFISIDTSFFSVADEGKIPVAPAMFYIDVNFDGIKDLILANNDQDKFSYSVREKDNVLLFFLGDPPPVPVNFAADFTFFKVYKLTRPFDRT